MSHNVKELMESLPRTKLSKEMIDLGVSAGSGETAGSFKLFDLPKVKDENVKKHFGSSIASQKSSKYSNSHTFKIDMVPFTLYMSSGEWRFGANSARVEDDSKLMQKLKKIQKLLEQ